MVLNALYSLVKAHGNDTQNQDAGDDQIQLEHLAAIDNQIAQPPPGGQEFPDDDTYQSQADIDLGGAEHNGDGAGQDHFAESIPLVASQSVDQRDFLAFHLYKSLIHI